MQEHKSLLMELLEVIERHRRKPQPEALDVARPGHLQRAVGWFRGHAAHCVNLIDDTKLVGQTLPGHQ